VTPTVAIGVVADARRDGMGVGLATEVDADYVGLDDGTLGCRGNHMAAWNWHAALEADWHVVLEDDALPIPQFRSQLTAALEVAPEPIVSLYLGGGYADDIRVRTAVSKADRTGAHWLLTSGTVLSAVALAVRDDLVGPMITGLGYRQRHAIDRAMSLWARGSGRRVAYAVPSLVDHADVTSLVAPHRRRSPRRALRVGPHEQWSNRTMLMV
jgi:GR25 family glycosyltransferase involved in LPS biosynthesis